MRTRMVLIGGGVVALGVLIGVGLWWFNLWPFRGKMYTMEELGILRVVAETDFDGDGIDDYYDIMLGARKDAERHPRYDGSYVDGGYPAEDVGVCTDVIWRALEEAGYDLKAMVDADIAKDKESYGIEVADPNIDFRRVKNLETFFRKYANARSVKEGGYEDWQPGDIVVFDDGGHIGIVSDRRTKEGRPYIIHNAGQPEREEDYLKRKPKVTGRYRWDGVL